MMLFKPHELILPVINGDNNPHKNPILIIDDLNIENPVYSQYNGFSNIGYQKEFNILPYSALEDTLIKANVIAGSINRSPAMVVLQSKIQIVHSICRNIANEQPQGFDMFALTIRGDYYYTHAYKKIGTVKDILNYIKGKAFI